MASGDALKPSEIKISGAVSVDLIAAVKFEETFFFVSFRELVQNKMIIQDTSFKYPKIGKVEFSPELDSLFQEQNPLIGIKDNKIIIKKKLEEVFGLQYTSEFTNKIIELNSSRSAVQLIEKMNSSVLSDKSVEKILNKYMNKDKIYLLRAIKKGKSDDKNLFVDKDRSYIHYKDFVNFLNYAGVDNIKGAEKYYFFQNTDLPRIATSKFLRSMLKEKGNFRGSFGDICWDIDRDLNLVSNVEYSKNFYVEKVNYSLFDAKESPSCYPGNFNIKDRIVGYYKDGVFERIEIDVLDKDQSAVSDYYIKNVKNKSSQFKQSYRKFRDFYSYPDKTLMIYVLQKVAKNPFFDTVSEKTSVQYARGFYKTLDPTKTYDYSFQTKLKRELLNFIMNNYTKGNRLTIRNPKNSDKVRKILIEIEKDILNGSPRKSFGNSYYVTLEDYIDLIEILTGRRDSLKKTRGIESRILKVGEGDAIKVFLSNPNVFYGDQYQNSYEILRHMSYFILCDKEENACDQVKTVDSYLDSDYESMDLLRNLPPEEGYKLYYNTSTGVFSESVL